MLRTAHGLRQAHIPARKILRSLRHLRETLPAELPLSGLRITAAGNEIAVRAGEARWQVDSGQLLLDFEVRPKGPGVRTLGEWPRREAEVGASPPAAGRGRGGDGEGPAPGQDEAAYWFERGAHLEDKQPVAAEAAYRRALAGAPSFADAYLNLGCLLCEAGRRDEAIALYRRALQHLPDEPLLHFNLAIALEDQKRPGEALHCYERCLVLARDFSDAHYNAALLCEQLGYANRAIKHFSAVRRLQKR